MKSPFPLLFLTLLVLGCTTSPGLLRPAQLAKNLPSLADAPLADRITPAPAVLLDDLKVSDKRLDYRTHPLTEADRAIVAEASAFMFLLTHEAAHVFDFVHGVTPIGISTTSSPGPNRRPPPCRRPSTPWQAAALLRSTDRRRPWRIGPSW